MMIKTNRLTLLTIDKKMFITLLRKKVYGSIICHTWPPAIVKSIIEHDLKKYKNKEEFMKWSVWLITLTETGEVIGDAGFKGIPNIDGFVDLGYSIESDYRLNGYCFEATSALVDFALGHHLVEGVTADCLKDNDGSKRNLEKLGFVNFREDESHYYWKKN